MLTCSFCLCHEIAFWPVPWLYFSFVFTLRPPPPTNSNYDLMLTCMEMFLIFFLLSWRCILWPQNWFFIIFFHADENFSWLNFCSSIVVGNEFLSCSPLFLHNPLSLISLIYWLKVFSCMSFLGTSSFPGCCWWLQKAFFCSFFFKLLSISKCFPFCKLNSNFRNRLR